MDFNRLQRHLGQLALGLLAVLIATVVWTVRPWAPSGGIGVAPLAAEEVAPTLRMRLTQVYAAFGETDEGAIYDGLARAVARDVLTELYLQRRAAQLRETAEEAGRTEIQALTLDKAEILSRDRGAYRIAAEWTVVGEVGHQDHRHERMNAYAATVTLGPADGEWRLTRFDLDQVRREAVPLFFGDLDLFGDEDGTDADAAE